jgi:hypothetical protein
LKWGRRATGHSDFFKKEGTMITKISKIIALTALIALAFGMISVGDAVAEEKAKGRYLIIWEMDQSKIPIDPKTRQAAWTPLVAMVKHQIQTGLTISWGGFVGETRGYTIMEGTVQEVHDACFRYVPFVIFKVYPLATLDEVGKMIQGIYKE